MSDNSSNPPFDASQIKLLSWDEAVRRRPRMYVPEISARGLSKAIADIAFDSLDPEKMNLSTETWITAHADFSYIFQDNGRGLPIQKRFGTTLENLHCGFPSYEKHGFLSHLDRGSILNALSEVFSVETTLDGVHSFIAFSLGQVTSPYTESAQTNKKGTKIISSLTRKSGKM